MEKLFLVRHGQSLWNLENRFTGWKDIDITEAGIEEAKKAGLALKGERIDIAFTSALIRAQHTLSIILNEIGNPNIPVIKDKALNERSYGNLEGLNKAETALKYGDEQVHIWRRSYDVIPPGGESLKDTYNRVIPYFENQIRPLLKQGENVLIVAHGNSLRALIMYLEHLSPEEILEREIATGFPLTYIFDEKFHVSRKVG
ncbi:2,3-bisphosphoglycerate-dependent phosphoglycerate mutase [Chryseobacterium bernardetii]|jgi:2,3-bisphosphoglycerate-dependent phosphoglycerate mutase|uniref:2,3-bisphosphoglycerate-dependent phosphoglycerate mutase n=3 Tax=Chryseobacterium TaxID=59732 RepID=A0A543EIY9_9FLAO|nr:MULTISPECIES: 2,3-bisphosphoglycerate-dependent phosphoglycerate mutase [Chryseobacterium]MDR6369986.1 2,3-bisphosphoglycerate-dependent phosphoglycerate mutase [Chryseobacterium vietnamense]MDR6440771.1 2,3-bisphosphoglycerate-dependent phosphoglycerate mutase [Chryseobacterium bernardetii]MDR6458013.1 2,3-bisphosphoglycerate-dependent phosphoglycerate mutase [Chryseobacterium vietnamense]MDR6486725.1 2,3-bisphosphoglycerate-dependent phosphoglycerate mutase [Chryseobacterium vietnamense]T